MFTPVLKPVKTPVLKKPHDGRDRTDSPVYITGETIDDYITDESGNPLTE